MTTNRRSKQSARQKAATQGLSYAQATGTRPAPSDAEHDPQTPAHMRSREAFVAYMENNAGKPLQLLVERYVKDQRLLDAMKSAVARINDGLDDAVTQIAAELVANTDPVTGEPRLDFGSDAMAVDFDRSWADLKVYASLLHAHGTPPTDIEDYDHRPEVTGPVVPVLQEVLKVANALRLPSDPAIFGALAFLHIDLKGLRLVLRDAEGNDLYQRAQRLDLVSQRQPA